MKVSAKWLKKYVDHDFTPAELAEKLTMTGAEVKEILDVGYEITHVVAGRILSIEKHEELKKLVVCVVDIGCSTIRVVTGAPNIKEGILVPIALAGASLAGGLRIEKASFAGIESEGMLCSEVELGIGQDASGIMILPETLNPGDDVIEALGVRDTLFDFEITPNRPDCLSVLGMAREVAAIIGRRVRYPVCDITPTGQKTANFVCVKILDKDLCRRYSARVIKGVEIKPSPQWLQERLRAAGMRPINNVVDITNFVLLEYGQPLHAFDYDLVKDRQILVRRAKEGEECTGIDGEKRILDKDMLVIADAERAIAIAGVMGGMNTEVTSKTRNVLLESANFNAASVRRTSRDLGLRTEASIRFEKGLSPALTIPALDRAAWLLQEIAGGKVLDGIVDVGDTEVSRVVIELSVPGVNKVLGTELSYADMKSILESLEFGVKVISPELLEVECPDFRQDIELEADLIEEIARLYGYDKIPATLPKGMITGGGLSRKHLIMEKIGKFLSDLGLNEVITYSFVHPNVFDKIHVPHDHTLQNCITIRNPLSEDQSVMRTTLIPSLLQALARNQAYGIRDMHIYELGSIYIPQDLSCESLPREIQTLAIALWGNRTEHSWDVPETEVDFFDMKGILEVLFKNLGIEMSVQPSDAPMFHPRQQAAVLAGGEWLGIMGQIHPAVAEEFELVGRVFIAELNVDGIVRLADFEKCYSQVPRYPSVVRDVAVVVPKEILAKELEEIIRRTETDFIEDINLFDVYMGKQIPEGCKSLAYSITYRAKDRTLTDEEVDAIQNRVLDALKSIGAEIRR